MNNIKAILIDIDNTILDFDECVKAGLKEGFKKFNLTKYQDYMYDIFERENTKLWKALERKEITFEELKAVRFNKVFEALSIDFDGVKFEKFFRDHLSRCAIPVLGAMDILKYLKKKYIISLASNGPYNQQVTRIKLAGMEELIDYYFISEEIGASKPSKAFFDECMKRLNEKEEVKIMECVMIGDSLTADIAGGNEYGMTTIYFNKNGKEDNDTITPTYRINKLSEIKEIL